MYYYFSTEAYSGLETTSQKPCFYAAF